MGSEHSARILPRHPHLPPSLRNGCIIGRWRP
ncbi:hypothetical protein HF086_000417 [Spodoptera exigua]|uniref:Uncharacterized protein n=1 Tax=Spodoptera exigua TaxID=7107 RepID=A0A922MAC1_SPOEX|nr:hypothetical protein HF086_000417 [Spodoptera exigua]